MGILPSIRPHRYTARMPLPSSDMVAAYTSKPPLNASSGYSPAASVILLISLCSSQPPPTPNTMPRPNWRTTSTTNIRLRPCSPLEIMSIRVMVRNTAIGSLLPDSISSVALTRSFRPLPPISEKTAAASVEPIIAPISKPCIRLILNNHAAASPVRPAVIRTPTVASDSAGHRATRKEEARVRMPPSSKITASARLLTR
ncbi:hypothetical protein SRABI106_03945 [Rahnella aquatilis]|nr:hypothetical protein SRABI106_03945 [Rahnella aquatilis]